MADTIRIGGIKLSPELVQIDFRESGSSGVTGVLDRIRKAKINIPHLHQGFVDKEMQTTVCIDAIDYLRLKTALDAELKNVWFRILPSVGTVSLFPHGSSINFVATVYAVLAENNIPVHGISSSVSALVIHTDYSEIDHAVSALLNVYTLPENHSPLHPEFRMQQVER